jgi:ketosteroid isomerase-like protein
MRREAINAVMLDRAIGIYLRKEAIMSNDLQHFEHFFMKARADAGRAFVNGKIELMSAILSNHAPVTFFGPRGAYEEGPEKVAALFKNESSNFIDGEGDSRFETLQMGASDNLAFWIGLQRGTARLNGKSDAMRFNLRITEIFRNESGEWRMIHRHADLLGS